MWSSVAVTVEERPAEHLESGRGAVGDKDGQPGGGREQTGVPGTVRRPSRQPAHPVPVQRLLHGARGAGRPLPQVLKQHPRWPVVEERRQLPRVDLQVPDEGRARTPPAPRGEPRGTPSTKQIQPVRFKVILEVIKDATRSLLLPSPPRSLHPPLPPPHPRHLISQPHLKDELIALVSSIAGL